MGRFISQDPTFWQLNIEYLVDPQQWNSYSYTKNNPIGYTDPDGKKVYAVAKGIEDHEIGTHVFLLMVPDNPSDFGINSGEWSVLGAYIGNYGNLQKKENAKSDTNVYQYGYSNPNEKKGKFKEMAEVQRPIGTTDTEFIQKIINEFNGYKDDAAYDSFAREGYNSNNFITTLLKNSGVKNLPWNGNAPGIDPGYGETIPEYYVRMNGKNLGPQTRSQGISALGVHSLKEGKRQTGLFSQGIGNMLQQNAAKIWGKVK